MKHSPSDSNRFRNLNQPKVYVQLDLLTENIPMYEEIKHYPKNSTQYKAFVKYSNVVCSAVFNNLKNQYGYKIVFIHVAGQDIEADALNITPLAIQELERIAFAYAA